VAARELARLDLIEVETGTSARAVFTTRVGGRSEGQFASLNLGPDRDDPDENVRHNRALVSTELGLDGEHVTMARQVHGGTVREVVYGGAGGFLGHPRDWPDSDALVTSTAEIPLVVLGADCLPVLFWRHDGHRVAAAHVGWRGLLADIVGNTVRAIGPPGEVGVAIGPGIGPCCYPVSDELRRRFTLRFGDAVVTGNAVNLAFATERALLEAGVASERISTIDACTACDGERFFSFRRDGVGGRQSGIVWLAE
jgi:polyphenol oxidase